MKLYIALSALLIASSAEAQLRTGVNQSVHVICDEGCAAPPSGVIMDVNLTQILGSAISATNPLPSELTNTTIAKAVAVRCVNAANNAFESCAGAGSSGLTDTELRASPINVLNQNSLDIQTIPPIVIDQTGTNNNVDANITNASLAVTGTFWQATQPVSFASPAITNTAFGIIQTGTNNDVDVVSSTLPTGASTLAEQQTQTTSLQLIDNIVSGTGANVSQINGVTPLMGNGVTGTGSLRVTVASDNTAFNVNNTPPANQSVNVNQIAGSAVVAAATGVQKVGIVGNAGAAIDSVNNSAPSANIINTGVETIAIGTAPTAATSTNERRQLSTTEGIAFTREGSSQPFSCLIPITATVTTQCQAAPAAGYRAYVTSVSMSNGAATVQGVDIVYGTGAACVTGITALTHKYQMGTNATTTSPFVVSVVFPTPLVPVAANAICARPTAGTAFGVTITGFIAP